MVCNLYRWCYGVNWHYVYRIEIIIIIIIFLGEYLIDLGAQWVHGQINNVAYELAAPLGLLENTTWKLALYNSAGTKIDETIFKNTINVFENALYNISIPDIDISVGEHYEQKYIISISYFLIIRFL